MKRCLALTLILVCFAVPAMAELAISLIDNDYYDVPFSTGYLGMDVDRGTLNAYYRDAFRVKDTSYTRNNYTNASIGNLLKIFATQHWDAFKQGPYHRGNYAWYFSNDFSTARVDAAVTDAIKASQLVIPDHGYVKEVEEGVFVTFDFAHFETTQDATWYPSFFGYKLAFAIDVAYKDAVTLTPWNADRFTAWQRLVNGAWVDVSTEAELTVSNPQPGDKYRFVNRTSFTKDGQTLQDTFEGFEYTFIFAQPPVIVSPAKDQTVTVQEKTGEISLTVEATGATEYVWYALMDGEWLKVTDASEDPKFEASGFTVARHDGLKLRCVARNDYGETVSPVFTLKVVPAAVPQTGDGAPLALYAGAMLLASAAILLLRRKAAR